MAFPVSRSSCGHLFSVDTQERNCWATGYMTSHSITGWQPFSKGAVLSAIPQQLSTCYSSSSLAPLILYQANWYKMIYLYDLNLHFMKH